MSNSPYIRIPRHAWILFLVVACILPVCKSCRADYAFDQALQVTAQTQKTPATITLNWAAKSATSQYSVYRRQPGQAAWSLVGNVSSVGTSFSDPNVSVGSVYEYKVNCSVSSGYTAYGYVQSGIEVPLVDNRGKVILLVDSSMSTPLQTELDRFVQDLTGDGWTVIRHDIARSATTTDVKAYILSDYQADPTNVKSVLIFGHLAMFFSGNMAPDGHAVRPWPTDQYYGDMDGTWTPNAMYSQASAIELQVGRVDLSSLPTFSPLTETDLLRRYLNKDHNYRFKTYAIQMKGFIDDNFTSYGEGFAQTGWRGFPTFVGTANVAAGDWTAAVTTPYLWGYGCGPGSYTSAAGVAQTSDLKTCDPAVFTFLFGSYFGQYDASDCFLRAALATPNYGLTCGWAGRPNWFVHHMALGETIGYSTLKTMNNNGTDYAPGYLGLQVDLMGDPTLRAFMVAPPATLTATPDDFGEADVSWSASTDTVLGYYVYRGALAQGPFTRITPNIVTTTTFHDANPSVGINYYMVRAVVLQTTPSGTYYNASQGCFATCNVPSSGIPTGGIKLWLKSSTGVTKDGSGLVSTWADQSGAGNNATQGNAAQQPLFVSNSVNGRPAIRFGGGDDVLQTAGLMTTGTGPFTAITYVSPRSVDNPQTLFWQGSATPTGGYGAYLSTLPGLAAGWGGAAGQIAATDTTSAGRWYLVSTTYDGTTHALRINGTPVGSIAKSDSNFLSGVFSVGNYGPDTTQGFNGDMAELLVYNRALSTDEVASAERALKYKYGRQAPYFDINPTVGLVPTTVAFDASASVDPDGTIVAYDWDFGDQTSSGSGALVSHTYTNSGTYVVKLTVTDNDGFKTDVTGNVTVMPAISAITLTGSPTSPIGIGTPVSLNAGVTGGYKVLYKFLINSGSGWSTYQDYSSASTALWTPSKVGNYRIQVVARSTDSTSIDYDMASAELNYIVAQIPMTNLRLWLRADNGISKDGNNKVYAWADQSGSGNNVTQSNPTYKPSWVDNVVNGKPVVNFQGQNTVLTGSGSVVTGSSDFTAFTIARISSLPGTNYQYIWWNGGDTPTGGYGCYVSLFNKFRCSWGSSSFALNSPSTVNVGDWYRICTRFTSGTHELWINGTWVGQNVKTGSNLGNSIAIGNYASSAAYQGFYGDLAEVLIYGKSLAESERQSIDQYLMSRWWPPVPTLVDRIGAAKAMDVGTLVSITSAKVVTVASGAFSDGSYYLEEPDRSSGIKIIGGTAALWENITLTGTVDTDANGEKVIRLITTDTRSSGTQLGTLGMANKSFAASGLLVRVWGRVLDKTSSYFTVDDGSGLPTTVDTSRLATALTVDVQPGSYVAVTGLAGVSSTGAVLLPRGDSDINIISN